MTTTQFPSALSSFIHNGDKLLVYHIPIILQKLCRLAAIVRTLTRWRFYAASLLFIYDGDTEVQDEYEEQQRAERQSGQLPHFDQSNIGPGELNIRLIDFAHCTTGDDFLSPLEPGDEDSSKTIADHSTDQDPRARFPPVHADEPDVGFLLGLQSICNSLKATWSEERQRRLEKNSEDEIGHLSIPDKRVFDCSLTKEANAKAASTLNQTMTTSA